MLGDRARAGCTCAEEGGRKGVELCIYFVLYFSRLGGFQEESSVDWADSKSSVDGSYTLDLLHIDLPQVVLPPQSRRHPKQ
jgi:hypothetical protein